MQATCIHHSKRPLLDNYFNYIEKKNLLKNVAVLFVSEPADEDSHYSIYEDINGTHIFANNDVSCAIFVRINRNGSQWKLDGVLAPGQISWKLREIFVNARNEIETGTWTPEEERRP